MPAFFIRRPIVAMVVALLTLLLGVVALVRLPVAQFPQILPPQVNLRASFPGADALTVEQSVATPIEQQMNGADGMLYIQSTSGNDGSMNQTVTFAVGTNSDINNVLVNNRYAQAQASLPQDVKNFGVTIKKSLAFPLVVISLYSPDGRYDSHFLTNYALININDALLRVPGVGDVRNLGAGEYAMRVWIDPDRLARLGLTAGDVVSALRAQNVVNPAGQVGAEPAPAGQQLTYTVRTQGRLRDAQQFGRVILRTNPDGSSVHLQDVARVELGALSYENYGTFNGKPAAVTAAFQTPGSNALEVADNIRARMRELATRFPPGIAYRISLDTTTPVRSGIWEIVRTLLIAVGLVVCVVFVFLRSWRATLIPLLTVPVALVGAFAVFPLLGFSINTLSLFGLVLAIGLVVDDAIVVVEAVEHHIEQGTPVREATLRAMQEVQGPVVAIALILAAVFIPVAFMSGISGRLYQQFALTIAISVLISAFNALSLSPALSALLLRPRSRPRAALGRLGARFERGFEHTSAFYMSVNRQLVRKLGLVLSLLVGVTAFSWLIGARLPTGFVPNEDQGYAVIGVQLPNGASLQRTRAVYDRIYQIVKDTPGIRTYNGIAGFSFFTRTSASYLGTGFIGLEPWDERRDPESSATAILAKLNRQFASISQAQVFAVAPPAIPGISSAGGFSMMLQDRSGGSYQFLAEQVAHFVAAAEKRPELAHLRPIFAPGVPQLYADVNRHKALQEGVSLGDVYGTLQTLLGGAYVNDFTRFGRQWRVFVQAEPRFRASPNDVGRLHVRNAQGEMVPLSSFVHVRMTTGPEFSVRFNLYRAVELQGTAAPGHSSGQALDALEQVAKRTLPAEMGYAWNALSYQERAAAGSAARVLGLSLVVVFLILAALYESWSLPFSVLLSTPVAVLGAYLGLLSRSFHNDVYAQIGLLVLVGLTAKNAILIVEFAKVRYDRGHDLIAATLEGARLRLRPILMTSFAFVFGCLPLWFASGAGAAARRVLGTAVISGMLAATLLGVFFIPALFVAVERTRTKLSRRRSAHAAASHPAE